MKDRKYKLTITLKSDLCVGSGYSYARVIDSDICYDDLGIPYIPAKRLKGCLREAAELIGNAVADTGGENAPQPEEQSGAQSGARTKAQAEAQIEALFGKAGADAATGLFLENAYIEDYGEIRREIEQLGKEFRRYITPQSILEQFTAVKAQTKIEKNGAAKDNSLRYTRTVSHYSPFGSGDEEMRFTADAVLPGTLDGGAVRLFERAVLALRNIGMDRNRGLGSVRCTAEQILKEDGAACTAEAIFAEDGPAPGTEVISAEGGSSSGEEVISREDGAPDGQSSGDRAEYTLRYSIKNTAPLVLSMGSDFKTEKYISGRSVRGFFAGAYLRSGDKSADDEEFKDLFLRNKVRFGGLYPAETGEDGTDVYYPAPVYINRLKKTKKYVNVSKTVPRTKEECARLGLPEAYAFGNGNQPKRLKGKFVCRKDGGIRVKEPATDIVYHHTKKSKKQRTEDGNLLYTTEALRGQQLFAGEIAGGKEQIMLLARLLLGNTLRFGKSKSSQYGTCVLAGNPVIAKAVGVGRVYKKGSRILAVLESDAVFVNETGYTVRWDEVRKQIRESLGIEADADKGYTELEAGILTGYYAKWNLSRQAVPAVKAGSTFEFVLGEDLETDSDVFWTGENNGEGFGRVRIIENGDRESDGGENGGGSCRIECTEEADDSAAERADAGRKPGKAEELFRKILLAEAKECLMMDAVRQNRNFGNVAALGRVTLMLSESLGAFPDDPAGAYQDFSRRIHSIRTRETREKAEETLYQLIWDETVPEGETPDREHLKYYSLVEELEPLYRSLQRQDTESSIDSAGSEEAEDRETAADRTDTENRNDEFLAEMAGLWGGYLYAVLVQEKYNLKHRENGTRKEDSDEED